MTLPIPLQHKRRNRTRKNTNTIQKHRIHKIEKIQTKTNIKGILLSDLLSPWSRVLLEKLTGLQLVKNFPVFYGTGRFITAFTSALHLSLSWARSFQSIHPHPTS
jgi:hypothetical protein